MHTHLEPERLRQDELCEPDAAAGDAAEDAVGDVSGHGTGGERDWLTLRQAAALLQVSVPTLRRRIRARELPARVQIGPGRREYVVHRADLAVLAPARRGRRRAPCQDVARVARPVQEPGALILRGAPAAPLVHVGGEAPASAPTPTPTEVMRAVASLQAQVALLAARMAELTQQVARLERALLPDEAGRRRRPWWHRLFARR